MTRRPRRLRLHPPALAALALVATAAGAQTSPWYIGGSQTFSHDSNLLRLADGQEAPAGYTKADTVSITSLLAGIDQPIGRQRVYGNLSVRSNRYSGNSRFDNTSYTSSLGLDWSTVERVSGSLYGYANRSLQNFSTDVFSPDRTKNLESARGLSGSVIVGLVTQYSLEVNAGRRSLENSLENAAVKSRDFVQDNASVGLRWRPSAVSNFGLALGATKGRNPRFATAGNGDYLADRFKRQDLEFTAGLRPGGASSFDIRLAQGRTRYDLNSRRNFSGFTGALNWAWVPTGKVSVNTSLSRDTGQDSYAATSITNTPSTVDYSRIANTLRTQLYYTASAKITATAGLTYTDRDLVRTLDDPLVPQSAVGKDRTTALTLGLRWTPTRTSLFGCDLGNEVRRGEGSLTSNLKADSFGCYAQITLQ